ncbi:hypothetical protein A0H76_904 [Hepatospora eriocheir]|uniref:Uncharacterized protein n=1 Tax=Hepatospora eriocheir TaxID=1081669 RepID=A0A1X0QIC3_9MICR|nr:hypothetical protein A0H76_904 [Hepatospora eriocheir]
MNKEGLIDKYKKLRAIATDHKNFKKDFKNFEFNKSNFVLQSVEFIKEYLMFYNEGDILYFVNKGVLILQRLFPDECNNKARIIYYLNQYIESLVEKSKYNLEKLKNNVISKEELNFKEDLNQLKESLKSVAEKASYVKEFFNKNDDNK